MVKINEGEEKEMKNPCYGCLNRKVGYHAVCEPYVAFDKKNKKESKRRAFISNVLSNPVKDKAINANVMRKVNR